MKSRRRRRRVRIKEVSIDLYKKGKERKWNEMKWNERKGKERLYRNLIENDNLMK